MNKKINLGILFLFLLIIIPSLSLAQPIFNRGNFLEGYEIKFPLIEEIKINQTNEFHFHVYNKSNGVPVNNNIGCYFHLYNQTNAHLAILESFTTSNDYDYEFVVDGANFSTEGVYNFVIQCNNTNQGGFVAELIDVSTNGSRKDEYSGLLIIGLLIGSIILTLGSGAVFAYLYANTDEVNKWIKILFLSAALLSCIIGAGIVANYVGFNSLVFGTDYADIVTSSLDLFIWVFRITMVLLILYILYYSAMYAVNKKVGGP